MKKLILTFILALCSLSLSGCYDSMEIDKSAYVIALGIDKGNSGYNYTFQISSPLAMGGGGEIGSMGEDGKNTRVENIVIGSDSLVNARVSLNNFLSKKISLSHLKVIVFSEEVAKTGLSSHLPFLLREREIRPTTRLAVSAQSAEEFLKGINPALEANTAEYYDLVFENGVAFAPEKTLWEFINEQETFASALPCGIISSASESAEFSEDMTSNRISTSKSEFSGLYLIKNYKLAGKLSPSQSIIYAAFGNKLSESELNIGNNSVKLYPTRKTKFRIIENGDSTTLVFHADFTAKQNTPDNKVTPSEIKNYLDTEFYSLIKTLQDSNSDIFLTGNNFKRRCKTINEWENFRQSEIFKTCYFMPEISISLS